MAIEDTDLILVNQSGVSKQVQAQNFDVVQDGDLLLVNRNNQSFRCTRADLDTKLLDDDLLLINRSSQSHRVSGAEFKQLLNTNVEVGGELGGGYFAGQINDGGIIYNIILAPKVSGGLEGQKGGAVAEKIQYKEVATGTAGDAKNQTYGGPIAETGIAYGVYPLFNWLIDPTGPNAGSFDLANGGAGGGTGIGGFNDWYIPAKNELEILYRNLKPDATPNSTIWGANPDAVPPTGNYTAGDPAQTTVALFQSGGGEDFATDTYYWSATEAPNASSAQFQNFSDGYQNYSSKVDPYYARAIRRFPA